MTDGDDRDDANRDPNDPDNPDAAADSPTGPMTDTPTDTDHTTRDRPPHTTDPENEPNGDANGGDDRFGRLSTDDLRGLIDRIGLTALILLALIAGWGFYSQAGRAIRTWLDPAYQPVALAAFNLAVLLVALAGVAHQLYRIRRSEQRDGKSAE